jgi:hypothetical protein
MPTTPPLQWKGFFAGIYLLEPSQGQEPLPAVDPANSVVRDYRTLVLPGMAIG